MSNLSELSEFIRINYPATQRSISCRGLVFGVGINDADYITRPVINGVNTECPAYRAWKSMLCRGYSMPYKIRQPTYLNVSVNKEWHLFSTFREWWIENHVDSFSLDKDLLVVDNDQYSKSNCIYVPQWLNSFLIDRFALRGCLPIGVSFDRNNSRYICQCHNPVTAKGEKVGRFKTAKSAHLAWRNRKLYWALELKDRMDAIDLRIYPNVCKIIMEAK